MCCAAGAGRRSNGTPRRRPRGLGPRALKRYASTPPARPWPKSAQTTRLPPGPPRWPQPTKPSPSSARTRQPNKGSQMISPVKNRKWKMLGLLVPLWLGACATASQPPLPNSPQKITLTPLGASVTASQPPLPNSPQKITLTPLGASVTGIGLKPSANWPETVSNYLRKVETFSSSATTK